VIAGRRFELKKDGERFILRINKSSSSFIENETSSNYLARGPRERPDEAQGRRLRSNLRERCEKK